MMSSREGGEAAGPTPAAGKMLLEQNPGRNVLRPISVRTVRLDSLVERVWGGGLLSDATAEDADHAWEKILRSIHLVKVDTEGHDLEVLSSMRGLFETAKVKKVRLGGATPVSVTGGPFSPALFLEVNAGNCHVFRGIEPGDVATELKSKLREFGYAAMEVAGKREYVLPGNLSPVNCLQFTPPASQ